MSSLPYDLEPTDLPVCVIPAGEFYVLFDVRGQERARFNSEEEAQQVAEKVNVKQPPELMQPGIHDTGTEPVRKERRKPKGKSMPRGIPKKKRASKKRAVKKAAVVKKTAKKTMNKVTKKKKKKTQRRSSDYW